MSTNHVRSHKAEKVLELARAQGAEKLLSSHETQHLLEVFLTGTSTAVADSKY